MKSSKASKVTYESICSLTSSSRGFDKEKIQFQENYAACQATDLHQRSDFHFDRIYNGKSEFSSLYDKHVYPIVEQTMAGKSVGIIANSIPNNDFTSYLATPDDGHSASLIVSIVAQLLKPINNHAGSVAFSWYKIGCDKDETITDVLRCASAAAASDPKAAEAASHLSLREVGRGRGMTVSGLWEVELASAADIEAIISHVLQMYPAGDSLSASHSVFQFVYTPREAKGTAAAKSILSNDSPGVGRFSFITLSCISSYDFNTLALARVARHPLHAYEHDWVQKLTHIVEWITSGRPSPPYHKSRLVLLLRDILCSRQSCLTLLCVDKFSSTNATQQMGTGSNTSVVSENDIVAMYYEQIHKWFQIMSCVSYARDPKRKTSNVRSLDLAKSSTQGTNTHQSSDKKNTPGKDILANNRRSSRSAPGGRTVLNSNRNDRSTPTPAVGGTNSRSSSANPRERQVAQAVKSEKSDTGSAGCNSSSNINPKEEHVVIRDNLMKKLNNDAPALPMTEASPPPPPPPVHTTTNTLNHVNTNGLGEIFPEIPYQEEYADIIPEVKPSAVPIAGRRKSVVADSKLHFHGSGHSHGIASGHGHAGGVESNGNAHDREAISFLAKNLEDSKRELLGLKEELEASNDRYESCRKAYDELRITIQQEGSMLKQKDRENYQKALRDLKDYAIYKEVIEAAMVRLQNELDTVLTENKQLKHDSEKNMKAMRQKLSSSQRYDAYASSVNKKYADADAKIQSLERDLKKALRDKEVAQTALTHSKKELEDLKGKYEGNGSLSYNGLIRRINELEHNANYKKYKSKQSLSTSGSEVVRFVPNQEFLQLQATHERSVETILQLEEENELLRRAVAEMTCDEELAEAARSTFANRPSGNDGATTKTKNGDMHSIVTSKDVDGVAEEQTAAVENVDDEAAPKQ